MYDYIIVGAGSAGCVLAARLTEDPLTRVLLVEAGGPDRKKEIHIPAAFSRLFKTDADWNFTTEPQAAMDGRSLYWPRGKVLGGSSSINAMIYMRGHRLDYDHWAALGCTGWSYEEVLPYFKRSEHNERGASPYHGAGGPLYVSDLVDPNPLSGVFVRACIEAGIPFNPDFNGARQEGAGLNQVNQRRGRRHSTAAAFLRPALRRPNLTVLTYAHTTKVLFEGTRAVGITYVRDGHAHAARAEREVILAAGAIGSPHLLMLSGVGPADHLTGVGAPVVHDLAGVGQNLQDHLISGLMHACTQPITLWNAEKPASLARFLLLRRGGLTSNVAEACAFVRTRAGLEAPDMQYHFGPVAFTNHNLEGIHEHAFTGGALLLQPRSAGFLALRSDDPFAAPAIDPQYLTDAEGADLRTIVEGLRILRDVFAQAPFDAYRGPEIQPGVHAETDAELAAFVRSNAETLYHPVGTCAMGVGAEAVVDPSLRVRGLDGLRVVDASVMPQIVRGNTNAPTIMIAEKAADLIRGVRPAASYARSAAAAA